MLTITYDGTNYSGWQSQNGVKTIQDLIEKAIAILLKEKIQLIAAGRTDAGVHALNQIAHFQTDKALDPKKIILSLNGILPKDIRIKNLQLQEKNFHARYSAKRKIYHYFVTLGPYQDPFDISFCYHIREKINIPLIQEAAKHFIGTHDFSSFSNENKKGCAAINPIKTIYRLDIKEINNNKLLFEFEGNGFLYKMVRNIVGTLIDISMNKIKIEDLEKIFSSKDRKKAGRAALAKGLFLVEVIYEKEKVSGISRNDSK